MRKNIADGKFYSSDKEELKKEIEKCFLGKLGPQQFSQEDNVKAIIVPHASYFYSGSCAAFGFKNIGYADVYLILSPNHSRKGITSLTTENYQSPFGIAKIDEDFKKILLENGIRDDFQSHEKEHSIEIQIPFLQYINDFEEIKIIPIVIGEDTNSRKLSDILSKSIKEYEKSGKIVKIIVTSDFTHYGSDYNYIPFVEKDLIETFEKIKKEDFKVIELIEDLNVEELNEFFNSSYINICGKLPILTLLRTLKKLDDNFIGELLQYYNSSEVLEDKENIVSYATISFKKNEE